MLDCVLCGPDRVLSHVLTSRRLVFVHRYSRPDESYLIWDEQGENGHGGADLFISFKQEDNSWGAAINLGDTINTSANEGGATVTPDGKYLFFNRFISNENAGMFWVDAQVIEMLRPK